MLNFRKGQDARLPVVLKTNAGSASPSRGANEVSFSVLDAFGSASDVTVSSTLWVEITQTAWNQQGYYNFILTGSFLTSSGIFQYCAFVSGCAPYFGVIQIIDNDEKDVFDRLGVPICGSISNDIQNIGTVSGSGGGFTSTDRGMLTATYTATLLIPADPATNSHVDAQLSLSFWTVDRANLAAIKAKTDNLPTDPADQSLVETAISNAVSTINNSTAAGFTQIKGTGWSANDTLRNISITASNVYSGMATQAYLSFSLGAITGAGFVSGSDDLHGLSLQLQGITPSSGGGGFSTTDRTALYSIFTSTQPLPADPASESAISGIISESRKQIRGEYPYGAINGQSTASLSIYGLSTASQDIRTRVITYIPTAQVASQADVVSARDYLAGAGYASASNSLVAITNLITGSNFTPSDRTLIQQISASVGLGLSGTANTILNNTVAIKNKTDLLPNDVVSSASLFPLLYVISGSVAVSGGFSNDDRDRIIAVKAKTDNLPAQPADATVTFNASDRTVLNQVYSKTNALPVDPSSNTQLLLVSQSLANLISSSQGSTSSSISASLSRTLVAVTNSFNVLNSKLGTPAGASVSADIASVGVAASNAYLAASSADANAIAAGAQATAASAGTANIISIIGTPMSGTVSADISATYHAALNASSSFSGSISASVDLSPVLKVLGRPITTIAQDIREVGKIANKSRK